MAKDEKKPDPKRDVANELLVDIDRDKDAMVFDEQGKLIKHSRLSNIDRKRTAE